MRLPERQVHVMRHAVKKLHCVINHATQRAVRCSDIRSLSAAVNPVTAAARLSRAGPAATVRVLLRFSALASVAAICVRRRTVAARPAVPPDPVASCASRPPMFLLPSAPLRLIALKRGTLLQLFVEDDVADERLHCRVQPTLVEKVFGEVTEACQTWLVAVLNSRLKPALCRGRLLRLVDSHE